MLLEDTISQARHMQYILSHLKLFTSSLKPCLQTRKPRKFRDGPGSICTTFCPSSAPKCKINTHNNVSKTLYLVPSTLPSSRKNLQKIQGIEFAHNHCWISGRRRVVCSANFLQKSLIAVRTPVMAAGLGSSDQARKKPSNQSLVHQVEYDRQGFVLCKSLPGFFGSALG